jgi:hypothetical protein
MQLKHAAVNTLITVFSLAIPWLSSHVCFHVGFVLNIAAVAVICLPGIPFDTAKHAQYSIVSHGGRVNGPLETVVSGDVTSTDPRNSINQHRNKIK